MDRRVLLVSNYNAIRKPWNGVPYEFFNVISGIESATIVAPEAASVEIAAGASVPDILRFTAQEMKRQLRRATGSGFVPSMRAAAVEQDYDLCLFMCQFSKNLADIEHVRNWRARSRFAAAFVLETWSSQFEKRKADLRILDRFDHVFVLNASSIPALQRYTSTPISFLPTAADSLASCPYPADPERVIDMLSMGRRLPKVHEATLRLAREKNLFYVHDIWTNFTARDWAEVRAANADMAKRSRYYVAWDPVVFNTKKDDVVQKDRAISTRYFEGAAGGAILLGSRPDCPEFDTLFNWPDALVKIAPDGSDLAATLAEFDTNAARSDAARRNNLLAALRRHDWAFRWEEILRHFDLEPTSAHAGRVAQMERIAAEIEVEAGEPSAYKKVSG